VQKEIYLHEVYTPLHKIQDVFIGPPGTIATGQCPLLCISRTLGRTL